MGWKKVRSTCPRCSGEGEIRETKECPRCAGKGMAPGFFVEKKICGKCDGHGSVVMLYRCSECGGRGWVYDKEWEDDD